MLLSIHYADRVYLLCHLVLLIKNKNVRPVHEAGFRFKQRTVDSSSTCFKHYNLTSVCMSLQHLKKENNFLCFKTKI